MIMDDNVGFTWLWFWPPVYENGLELNLPYMQCIFTNRKKNKAVEQIDRPKEFKKPAQTNMGSNMSPVGSIPCRDAKVLFGPWQPEWKKQPHKLARYDWVCLTKKSGSKHRKLPTHSKNAAGFNNDRTKPWDQKMIEAESKIQLWSYSFTSQV